MDLDLGRQSIVEWAESAPEDAGADFIPSENKFSIETSIGRGGMGEVFLVSDMDLRRQVAMKVLRPDTGPGESNPIGFASSLRGAELERQLVRPAAAATATTRGARLGLVDLDIAPVELVAVELLDRGLGILRGSHLDEGKTSGAAGLAIGDDADLLDGSPAAFEESPEARLAGFEGEIPHVEVRSHDPATFPSAPVLP